MRAVVYTRISQDDGRALGVKRQEADCRALCEARGWDVTDVLTDNDVSAYTGRRRPGYDTLLDGIRASRWDVIVVWHPDRLHRRPIELEEFIVAVETSGVQVSTVTAGEWDLATPDGRLMARITGSVARKESEDKSRRATRKALEKAERGEFSGGGHRAFGYEPGFSAIRQEEADLIREAVAKVLDGASLRSIALDWNGRVSTVAGGRWTTTTVKRLLISPRNAGLRSHRGKVVGPATWPAIIDPDDYARIRALLGSRTSPAPARSYLLSGFLVCGRCGTRMVSYPIRRNGVKLRRYSCQKDHGGCSLSISAPPTEEKVAELVIAYLSRDDLPTPEPVIPSTDEIDVQMLELADAYGAGVIGMAEWRAAREGLERRREKILTEGADALARASRGDWVGPDAASRWEVAGFDERRSMIAAVVDHVEIAPATPGAGFDPNRVKPSFRGDL